MYLKRKIKIYSTNMSEWLSLVVDAQSKQSTYLCEDLESYLVFLLMRFSDKPNILSKVICLELLEINYSGSRVLEQDLQEIGDTCLIFSGLYPEISKKRNVNNSYYTEMGKTAYGTLSNHKDSIHRKLYGLLYQEFTSLTNVLQAMRDISSKDMFSL